MNRNFLARILLIFVMLFVQQGAFSHELSHLSDPPASKSGQDKKPPHNGQCAKCAEYAQLSGSIPTIFVPMVIHQVEEEQIVTHTGTFSSRSFFPYSSRAPPVLA